MRLSLAFIREALGLAPDGPEAEVTRVTTDSRDVGPGTLFVCIPGERVDGHDFVAQAVESGAAAILAQRPVCMGAPVIEVPDTVRALGALAKAARARTGATVIGLTGTAGKTTLKEVLAAILSADGETARTARNLNNQIGLPLSMLNAPDTARWWVMEAGISHPHDMDELGDMLRPDVALVLNVGPGHTEGLGDRGVAHYKARLLNYVAPGGLAFVSADYPELVREARLVRPELIFFSTTGRQVDYRAAYVVPAGEAKGLYRLWLDGDPMDVEAPFRGRFGAENVIAAAAIAHRLGLSRETIAAGLATAELPAQRFTSSREGRWRLIDDSYNANPLSMARMLEAASELGGEAPLVCVLGEMLELGAQAADEHEKLGQLVAEMKVAALFWKGGHGAEIAAGLEKARFGGLFRRLTEPADFVAALEALQVPEGVILFKGSRGNKLETLVPVFVDYARTHHAV